MPRNIEKSLASSRQDYIHPELRNLVPLLDEDEIRDIGRQCLENFKIDLESRQEWDTMHADWLRMYFQKDRPLNPPWEGASDESIPIVAEACNQFHARAFRAMFPTRDVIKAIPVGSPDSFSKERAERVSKHMSWQLMVRDKTYKRNKDRLLLSLPLHGSFFTKTFYDPVRKHNVVRNVRAVDLVAPYGIGPRDLEEVERKTEIIWMSIARSKYLESIGYFSGVAEPYTRGEKSGQDTAHDEATGLQESPRQDSLPAKLIEQHRLIDLDGDGLGEPYIVTVDCQSEKVLRVSIRWDTDELGNPTDDREPIEYYTHYPFLDNPDGFYGLGMGHLLGQMNKAVNKLMRQTIDAATLANVGNMSGFISKGLAVKKGELQFQMGKFVTTESQVDDLARGFFQFKFPGPQPVLPETVQLLMQRSDRLGSVTEAITGTTEKVMQPTTILSLIEQSQLWFSTVYERILDSWARELEKIFRLNRKFMDPKEYFAVLDIDGAVQKLHAARDDYKDDLQITPIADPRMMTEEQRIAKAQTEWQFLAQNPLVLQSPIHLYNASKSYLEAIGTENIGEKLPDPTAGQLPRVDDPRAENMGALAPLPMVPSVFPDQDHLGHIRVHEELLQDQAYGARLTDAGRQALEQHVQSHLAMMYGALENGQAGQVGPGNVAQLGGNGSVPPGGAPEVQPEQALGPGGLVGADQPPQRPI